VIDWLDTLDDERAQSVLIGLRFFEEYPAALLPSKFFEKVSPHLWEIKVHHGQEQFRLLAFLEGASVVVAAHAFAKKSMRLKPRDLRLAELRRRDHFERKTKGP
jgi:phage-related protein